MDAAATAAAAAAQEEEQAMAMSEAAKLTCDVLCSLRTPCAAGAAALPPAAAAPQAAAPTTTTLPQQHLPPPISSMSSMPVPHAAQGQYPPPPPHSSAAAAAHLPPHDSSAVSCSTYPVPWSTTANHHMNRQRSTKSQSQSQSPKTTSTTCPRQHQLPMFLSKSYHMIDKCNPDIATWSESGDSFVVKNVDKFSSEVLPLYFKHSNFSSFARQLNFYGFRKLRSDPILTSDVDPQTANFIRFYHSKFQRDKPELLHQIKRATKSEQQSKDDVEGLKSEVCKLKDCVQHMAADMERKMNEMSYEYNRRISTLSGEYDKLAGLVTQLLQHHQHQASGGTGPPPPPVMLHAAPPHLAHHPVPSYVTTHHPHAASIPAGSAAGPSFAHHYGAVAPPPPPHVAANPPAAAAAAAAPAHCPSLDVTLSNTLTKRLDELDNQQKAVKAAAAEATMSNTLAKRLDELDRQQRDDKEAAATQPEAVTSTEAPAEGRKRPAPEGDQQDGTPGTARAKVDES